MSGYLSLSPVSAPSALNLDSRSLAVKAVAVVLGTAVLALAAQIEVPMFPVPMTMQTLAVTLIGALYGWRLGALTIIAYLIEGAVGLPVFAGASFGIAKFVGPTGGYLIGFVATAALVGWLAERGWNGKKPVLSFLAQVLGTALCLAIGGAWLATQIGVEKALEYGVTPFLVGSILKSVLGAAAVMAVEGVAKGQPKA